MGNPAYDARRAAEQADAEKRKADAELETAARNALTDFLSGRASFHVTPMMPGVGMSIRLVRDQR